MLVSGHHLILGLYEDLNLWSFQMVRKKITAKLLNWKLSI